MYAIRSYYGTGAEVPHGGMERDRITSYNVCYTKLLRLTVPGERILETIGERYCLTPLEKEDLSGPARYYRVEGAVGMIGLITPVSCHFCGDCNRIP